MFLLWLGVCFAPSESLCNKAAVNLTCAERWSLFNSSNARNMEDMKLVLFQKHTLWLIENMSIAWWFHIDIRWVDSVFLVLSVVSRPHPVSDLCCFHLREHMHARDEFSELEYFLSVSRLTLPNTHTHTHTHTQIQRTAQWNNVIERDRDRN